MMSWCDVHVECFLNELKDLCNCVMGAEPTTSDQEKCSAMLLLSLRRVYNIEQFLPVHIQLS